MFFSLPSSGISWCLVLTKLRSKLLHGVFLLAKPFFSVQRQRTSTRRTASEDTRLYVTSVSKPISKSEDENWMLKLNLTKPMKQPLSLQLAFWTLFIKTNLFCSKICQQNLVFSGLSFSTLSEKTPQLWDLRSYKRGGVMHAAVQEIAICFPTIRRYLSIHLCFPKKNSYILNLFFETGSSPKETSWWVAAVFVCFVGSFSSCRLSSPPWRPPWPQAIFPLVVPTCHSGIAESRIGQPSHLSMRLT